jgi:lipid-A-disaccharide synthase
MTALKLAVIAGEPSGDILGADLVRQIAVQSGEKTRIGRRRW